MGCCPSQRSTTGFWLSYLQAEAQPPNRAKARSWPSINANKSGELKTSKNFLWEKTRTYENSCTISLRRSV
jgi:hypothetical protein